MLPAHRLTPACFGLPPQPHSPPVAVGTGMSVTYRVTQQAPRCPVSAAAQGELWQCHQVAWAGKEASQVPGQRVWRDCCQPGEFSIHHLFTRKFQRHLAGKNKMWSNRICRVTAQKALTRIANLYAAVMVYCWVLYVRLKKSEWIFLSRSMTSRFGKA